MKFYGYSGCDTCRKAKAFLASKKVKFEEIPIREKPPTAKELRQMLASYEGDLRRLFNTSGQDYRALNMKERLPKMSAEEAIDLLSKNGNLVKRPFLLNGDKGVVGFDPVAWAKVI